MSTILKERVQVGIEFLDSEVGTDWRERIRVDRLDINDASRCVLGQLYGDYDDGVYALCLASEEAIEYGFLLNARDGLSYEQLNEVWKLALSA